LLYETLASCIKKKCPALVPLGIKTRDPFYSLIPSVGLISKTESCHAAAAIPSLLMQKVALLGPIHLAGP